MLKKIFDDIAEHHYKWELIDSTIVEDCEYGYLYRNESEGLFLILGFENQDSLREGQPKVIKIYAQ